MFDLSIPLGGLEHPELLEEACLYTLSAGTGGGLVLRSYAYSCSSALNFWSNTLGFAMLLSSTVSLLVHRSIFHQNMLDHSIFVF